MCTTSMPFVVECISMDQPTKNVCNGEKILIITGNRVLGEGLKKKLGDIGYEVYFESDGMQGMKALFDTLPHLVLIDIQISTVDGYQILKKKQAEPLLAKIPVFLMSTQGVPINMREVPTGSVKEFIVSLNTDPEDVGNRVLNYFNCLPGPEAKGGDKATGPMKKILWVEDDKLIGNILGKKLVNSGFDLVQTKNGEEALKELEHIMPNAILIDLLLPGMSGFDILQAIRANTKFANTPVMILSNLSKPSDIEKAKSLGAQKFLVKATASLDQIVAEVRNLSQG